MAGYSYVQILKNMAELAPLIQPPLPSSAMARYKSLASDAMNAFHSTFWNQRLNAYGGDSGAVQSLNIPGLDLGVAASHGVEGQVLQRLQHDLENQTNYHLRVGAVVSKMLLTTLSEHGMHTSALKVASQEDEPSWGYWLSQNASSCWEAWPGATDGSTSRNHIFLCGGETPERYKLHARAHTFQLICL
jgi:alpha-L-rhamnosidase